jgi:hypothetical protein
MKASIVVTITEDNGDPFFDTTVGYSNLSRADVVALEKVMLDSLKQLHDMGVEKAKGKDKPKQAGI